MCIRDSYTALATMFYAMLGVVTSEGGFSFLFFWELMTVASFLLILFDAERREVRRAALAYVITVSYTPLVAQLKSEELSSLFFILSTDSSVSVCETPRRPSTANRHCGKNRTADFHNARPHPAAVSKLGAQTSFDFCFPSCLTRRNAVRLYCTGDMKNSSGIVQGAGYTRKSDASGKSVRI